VVLADRLRVFREVRGEELIHAEICHPAGGDQ
jgi:hypothetical protein